MPFRSGPRHHGQSPTFRRYRPSPKGPSAGGPALTEQRAARLAMPVRTPWIGIPRDCSKLENLAARHKFRSANAELHIEIELPKVNHETLAHPLARPSPHSQSICSGTPGSLATLGSNRNRPTGRSVCLAPRQLLLARGILPCALRTRLPDYVHEGRRVADEHAVVSCHGVSLCDML